MLSKRDPGFSRTSVAVLLACVCFLIFHPATNCAIGAEPDANRISERIRLRHLPFGTILDPVLDPNGTIAGYSRCGDSAIWTGHYLAAESIRWRVTRDPQALESAQTALRGLRLLADVTGGGSLARCAVPVNSPFARGILNEEHIHGYYSGMFEGTAYYWVGNTSRDQYLGAFYGLATSFEFLEEPALKTQARNLATSLIDRLLETGWMVVMPDGSISTTFLNRADQQLAILQIGRVVNPDRFRRQYEFNRFFQAWNVAAPVAIDAADQHNSYFKFNLDAISFFSLVRHESSRTWRRQYDWAYGVFRRAVDGHENAFFNMIDRAIRGPDARRDAETRLLLDRWLLRPPNNPYVDLRQSYPACDQEDRSCVLIPVEKRPPTDFLWQRSPFLLKGGGTGAIEGAGIDYILPYWMARYYGVL